MGPRTCTASCQALPQARDMVSTRGGTSSTASRVGRGRPGSPTTTSTKHTRVSRPPAPVWRAPTTVPATSASATPAYPASGARRRRSRRTTSSPHSPRGRRRGIAGVRPCTMSSVPTSRPTLHGTKVLITRPSRVSSWAGERENYQGHPGLTVPSTPDPRPSTGTRGARGPRGTTTGARDGHTERDRRATGGTVSQPTTSVTPRVTRRAPGPGVGQTVVAVERTRNHRTHRVSTDKKTRDRSPLRGRGVTLYPRILETNSRICAVSVPRSTRTTTATWSPTPRQTSVRVRVNCSRLGLGGVPDDRSGRSVRGGATPAPTPWTELSTRDTRHRTKDCPEPGPRASRHEPRRPSGT